MKKRGVPPIKKDCMIKELSVRGKNQSKKDELDKRMEIEKNSAIPNIKLL